MNTDVYKSKLQEERATLVAELGSLGKRDGANTEWEAAPDVADPANADSNTQATRFEDFEEKTAVMIPLEARLHEVESALASIASGTYGTCRACGGEIEPARLEANPAAITCMKHLTQ